MDITRKPPVVAVKEFLASMQLPTSDITADHMANYFGAWSDSTLVGVVGIEPHGSVALLRSLAVAASKRGSGIGSALLKQAEQYAMEGCFRSMFLLTTTSEAFFKKHRYSTISRDKAPEEIRNTAEFAGICPSGSVLMVKRLPANTPLNLGRGGVASRTG